MSLQETVEVDKVEVFANGFVSVRQATTITRNGELVARTFHRWGLAPGAD